MLLLHACVQTADALDGHKVFVEVIETLPDIESTKQGSKRRELAELRLKLQAAREDVQQRAEGCSHTKVCELYQQQLEITHRMIEQVRRPLVRRVPPQQEKGILRGLSASTLNALTGARRRSKTSA